MLFLFFRLENVVKIAQEEFDVAQKKVIFILLCLIPFCY